MKQFYLLFLAINLQCVLAYSNVKSQRVMQQCEPDKVQWFPHPNSCTMYVLCFHGNPIERVCAPGLHFNSVYKQCMLPQLAKCDINSFCPLIDDVLNPVFLPDGSDCTKYFVCFEGTAIGRSCAEGFWFDVVYNWCTFPDDVSCDYRTPNNPNPGPSVPTELPTTTTTTTELPTTTTTTTEVPSTTTTTTQEPKTTVSTTTQDPNTYNCPLNDEVTLHPHPLDCIKYFICFKGVGYLRVCAEGLLFDIIQNMCYREDDAQCIAGSYK